MDRARRVDAAVPMATHIMLAPSANQQEREGHRSIVSSEVKRGT
jgi:hypothetical protein